MAIQNQHNISSHLSCNEDSTYIQQQQRPVTIPTSQTTTTTAYSQLPCASLAMPPQARYSPQSSILVDSGATDTLIRQSDRQSLVTNYKTGPSIIVSLPNGNEIESTGVGTLASLIPPSESHDASTSELRTIPAHVFNDIDLSHSLLAISDYCNRGCTATLNRFGITIVHDETQTVVAHGEKEKHDRLWRLTTTTSSGDQHGTARQPEEQHRTFAAVHHQINAEFVHYSASILGNPPIPTLLTALRRGYIRTYPRLTLNMVLQNPPVSMATGKGHLDLIRQGIQPTTQRAHHRRRRGDSSTDEHADGSDRRRIDHPLLPLPTPTTEIIAASLPLEDGGGEQEGGVEVAAEHTVDDVDDQSPGEVYSAAVEFTHSDLTSIHSDLTGRFPVTSRAGHQYILVTIYRGYIHLQPMISRHASEYVKAFTETIAFFRDCGHTITKQVMDNEKSAAVERFFKAANIELQYVPPNNHRANRAERAIRSAKNHVLSSFATADPSFPMDMWHETLPQIEDTLNLLRPYAPDTSKSAYEGIHGHTYDFSRHPMAPVGTQVLVHDPPGSRPSWAPHGTPGYYLRPSMKHYRCYVVYAPNTGGTRITDTVAWYPRPYYLPGARTEDILLAAADTLRHDVRNLLNDITTLLHQPSAEPPLSDLSANGTGLVSSRSVEKTVATLTDKVLAALTHAADVARSLQHPPIPPPHMLASTTEGEWRTPIPLPDTRHPGAPTSATRTQPSTAIAPAPTALDMATEEETAAGTLSPDTTRMTAGNRRVGTEDSNNDHPPQQRRLDGGTEEQQQQDNNRIRAGDRWATVSRHKKKRPGTTRQRSTRNQPSAPAAPIILTAPPPGLPAPNPAERPSTGRPKRRTQLPQRFLAACMKRVPLSKPEFPIPTHVHGTIRGLVNTAVDLDSHGAPLTYRTAKSGPDRHLWEQAEHEEFLRLIDETQTMHFIHATQKPDDRKASYYNPQVRTKVKNGKLVHRVRGTIGGDQVDYPYDVTAWTADLQTIKILLNATVSEKAEFMTADIKDFYLGTTLKRSEYMWIHRKHIPPQTMAHFNVEQFMDGDYVLVEIVKGIYGLPQAGRLAQERLIEHLAKHGYRPCEHTPCLFKHDTRPIAFTLVVDDFGIKYHGREHAEHLLTALKELYTVTEDWTGSKYVGITIKHDKKEHKVTISMPGYVDKALQRFGVQKHKRDTHSPSAYVPPTYGHASGTQEVKPPDDSPSLSPQRKKRLQQIIGVFLYYARAVDPTMLTALSKLASRQSAATELVEQDVERFLQYAATWPDAQIEYRPSTMQLEVHSDASFLSENDAQSRAGGIFFLATQTDADPRMPTNTAETQQYEHNPAVSTHRLDTYPIIPSLNGPIDCQSTIIKAVVASACEAEYAALFHNGRTAIALRATLEDLGYKQKPTRIVADNACAVGLANEKMKSRRSKSMDMRYHWTRYQVREGVFEIRWFPGQINIADYFTKVHPVKHFKAMRTYFLRGQQPHPARGMPQASPWQSRNTFLALVDNEEDNDHYEQGGCVGAPTARA